MKIVTPARRSLLHAAAAAALGLFAGAAFPTCAQAQDMSKGANNFYISNSVTVQKVPFTNQYGMKVAGNLFIQGV
ncbi:MAG TPA: hypothetical protein VGB62_05400 [Allosphingosinicella sp.]|jgi:hypothetical protein